MGRREPRNEAIEALQGMSAGQLDELNKKLSSDDTEAERELLSGMQWIAQQTCEQHAEGSSNEFQCLDTGACVTEMCMPCYARAVLNSLADHLESKEEGS